MIGTGSIVEYIVQYDEDQQNIESALVAGHIEGPNGEDWLAGVTFTGEYVVIPVTNVLDTTIGETNHEVDW